MTALHGSSDESSSAQLLVEEDPELEDRYRAYLRRQAGAFASLIPREAVRPLYGQARSWAKESGLDVGKDPMATFLLFLQDFLPLPPFDVWLADRVQHLEAHLEEEFAPEEVHRSASPPVTVESRGMLMEGRRWRASLNLFRREDAWRGYIAFRSQDGSEGRRTADIFRDEDPDEIRRRFLSFHSQTLQAFLRSVLP
jgi:hypothetical protein